MAAPPPAASPAVAAAAKPSGSGRAPVACAGPNPVQGRQPSALRGMDPTLPAVGRTSGGPAARRGALSFPAGPSGRPRAPKLCEESWRRGRAAHSWLRKGLSFGKRPDDVAGLESGLEGVGGRAEGSGRRGEEGGIEWGTRGPSAPACGLQSGGAPGSQLASDGKGLGRGAAGDAVRGRPGSGRSGGRRGNFPECWRRLSAPPGGGAGVTVSLALPRAAQREGAGPGGPGHSGLCSSRPFRATMNGLAVPGPDGSGHLQPGWPKALAPGLSPAWACRVRGPLPGAGGHRLWSALPVGRPGDFRAPSLNGSSVWCIG